MIRKWPGQTKEEWLKEYYRDKALTPEERERELNDFLGGMKKKEDGLEQKKPVQKQQNAETFFENCDHPNSLENDEATIVWVVVMAVATIFKANWLIWIVATIIWRRYITRHKRKK